MVESRDPFEGIPCPGFAHGEHTADILVIAKGRSLEELFEQAALAVYEIITNTKSVKPQVKVEISENGMDLYNLLYRWIEALIFYTDTEGLVFSRFNVNRLWEEGGEWRLQATAWGEKFDPERHEHRTIVKAMTYAQMEIRRLSDSCWGATFVPDI